VIVLTSLEADEAEVEVRRRGADGFLRKPFHCDTLRDHVRALLPKTLNP
jgi:DNA-binding response OmpR family regulator